ncbi:MAG: winged helix family transcriptional regulator, partial [Chitinophagaceae bacterium]
VINRELAAGLPGTDYIVNVIGRPSETVVFGYAVLHSRRQEVLPCVGRVQPHGLYDLSIRFRETPFWSGSRIPGAAAALLAVGLLLAGIRRRRAAPAMPPAAGPEPETPAEAGIPLGRYRFMPAQQCLLLGTERVALTGKEASLLALFAASPNRVIDRQRLQKIWDDEGVIVGRSLDVFVSRLRKKLEADPGLAIVNIHGKGYKLEVAEVRA